MEPGRERRERRSPPQPLASRRRGGRPRRGAARPARARPRAPGSDDLTMATHTLDFERPLLELERQIEEDRKSTRLNSSHGYISYAVFCLKKKKKKLQRTLAP